MLLTFADRSALTRHIQLISAWEEFKRFASTIRLVDVRVYGKLSPEAEAFVRQFGDNLTMFEQPVAGFVRAPGASVAGEAAG